MTIILSKNILNLKNKRCKNKMTKKEKAESLMTKVSKYQIISKLIKFKKTIFKLKI